MRCVLGTTICDVCLRHVGFLQLLWFPPPMKQTSIHDITAILLKVALNTLALANQIQLALECLWFKEFRSFWTSEIT